MPIPIKITIKDLVLNAVLYDTDCAKAVARLLPIEAALQEWGDEFYCTVPLALPLDATGKTTVTPGDIGYWPPGKALAIFFGRTPMSTDDRPVPASAVNVVGRVLGDSTRLRWVKGAETIRWERF